VMFAGVLIAFAPPRHSASTPSSGSTSPRGARNSGPSKSGGSSSFMQNMNDRWEKRQDNRDQ
jgi:hypothetical protein